MRKWFANMEIDNGDEVRIMDTGYHTILIPEHLLEKPLVALIHSSKKYFSKYKIELYVEEKDGLYVPAIQASSDAANLVKTGRVVKSLFKVGPACFKIEIKEK